MDYTLTNFNIPKHLKDDLDKLAKFKRVSKTSIINTLLEQYCREELDALKESKELHELIASLSQQSVQEEPWEPPTIPDLESEDVWHTDFYR